VRIVGQLLLHLRHNQTDLDPVTTEGLVAVSLKLKKSYKAICKNYRLLHIRLGSAVCRYVPVSVKIK
jgi:hypothetical protein